MEHTHEAHGPPQGLNRLAASATTHCLTGCAIGEVAGMALAAAFGWGNRAQIVLAIVLAAIDNLTVLVIPDALDAGLGDALFYGSIAAGVAIAYRAVFLANRYLIARGKGHAVVHEHHAH